MTLLSRRSGGLDVVQENVEGLTLRAIVLHNDARAPNNLSRGTLFVDLAETGPLAELELGLDPNQVNRVVCAECLNELLVRLLVAVLGEDAQVCLQSIGRWDSWSSTKVYVSASPNQLVRTDIAK
jgi:hypothetical protein